MKKAVVLLSGGLDSTTTLALAKTDGYEMYALSFNYGQRHEVELEYAKKVAESIGAAKHLVIDINLRGIGGSALTSDIKVPKDRTEITDHRQQTDIPVTYVPARNTIFLSFALAWAETLEASDIFIGANVIDYSGYPDCRPEFIKAFEDMSNLATKISIEGKVKFKIHTPLINLTKSDIIRKGHKLGVDYSLTWSCYDPQKTEHRIQSLPTGQAGTDHGVEYIPCGKCDSCIIRTRGFEESGIIDPLKHKDQH